jgi:mRNA interferase MazF
MIEVPAAAQGEVWDAVLGPGVGREQAGFRPVLAFSVNEVGLGPGDMVIAVPFTSAREYPLSVTVDPPEGGLEKQSFALVNQISAISRHRLKRFRGIVSEETLRSVHEVLGVLTRVD